MIEATIYSYKNKNLLDVVNTLVQNTTNEIIINVYDQHQFDRSTLFQNYYNVIYNHIFWDYQDSPTKYKAITIAETNADYILLLSDDVIVRPGWDVELINFIKDSQVVISGMGNVCLTIKDIFSLKKQMLESTNYTVTNIIDRNFIFAKTSSFRSISYPKNIKYYGEEEMTSILFSCTGHTICSVPTGFYEDLSLRTIENLYTPFSKEHGYNEFVKSIKNEELVNVSGWLEYHKINPDLIYPLPYQTDDVSYDPNTMVIDVDDIGGKRFTNNLKAIF